MLKAPLATQEHPGAQPLLNMVLTTLPLSANTFLPPRVCLDNKECSLSKPNSTRVYQAGSRSIVAISGSDLNSTTAATMAVSDLEAPSTTSLGNVLLDRPAHPTLPRAAATCKSPKRSLLVQAAGAMLLSVLMPSACEHGLRAEPS